MPQTLSGTIDTVLAELTTGRKVVSKSKQRQVRNTDEKDALRSLAYAWFNSHRGKLAAAGVDLQAADQAFTTILNSSNRFAARATYVGAIKAAHSSLIRARASLVAQATPTSSDSPPDFAPLASNLAMQAVLQRRWSECAKCVGARADLAAIVMMGGLLEALFVAKANSLKDKSTLVKANAAPKDKATGKVVNYQTWMLDSYIQVGHELGWISDSAKSLADTVKEYRNYVHPEKELRHNLKLSEGDAALFWNVTKGLVTQLLKST